MCLIGLMALLLLSALLTGCVGGESISFTQEAMNETSPELRENIEGIIRKFDDEIGCGRDIEVGWTEARIEIEDGQAVAYEAEAFPGQILISNPVSSFTVGEGEGAVTYEIYVSPYFLENMIAHELGHACRPDTPTMLSEEDQIVLPVEMGGGGKIIGFTGLGLIIELPDGLTTSFTIFDEGNASSNTITMEYGDPLSDGWHGLGVLTSVKLNGRKSFQPYARSNNVLGFVAAVNGITVSQVTNQHLFDLMWEYQTAR